MKIFFTKYWPVFAGFFIIQILLDQARDWSYFVTGKTSSHDWYFGLINSLIDYLLWVVILIILAWLYLGLRSQFAKEKWIKIGAAVFLLSTVQAFLHQFIYLSFYNSVKNTQRPFGEIFSENILFFVPSIFLGVLIALFLLSLIIGLDYYEQYSNENLRRSALELELMNARLETIQAQLNPHFLFNSLNTISMMVRAKEDIKAVSMISSLSDLLRMSLQMKAAHLIPLGEEIRAASKYLKIEEERFSDRLKVLVEIHPDTERMGVPNLMLQPILENALKYGVSDNLNDAFIHIWSFVDTNQLTIKVSNIGSTLPTGFTLETDKGNGLMNVDNRLKHLFDQYVFTISEEPDKQMVTVTITIPIFNLEDDSDSNRR